MTDVGFGRGKVSVIQSTDEIKITEIDSDSVKPIFSESLDLSGTIGLNLETSALFEAVMNLKKQQSTDSPSIEFLPGMQESSEELLSSSTILLVMLLKVTLLMPKIEGGNSDSISALMQTLIQISESGKGSSEIEGKPQAFWENA